MIPIRDDTPRYSTPYVNNFIIGLNTIVFLLMWIGVPAPAQQVVNVFGFEPVRLTAFLSGASAINVQGALVPVNAASAFVPVFTSMFMHASWLHLIFNMWGLWIFGDNIEDYLGHFRYLLFYLVTGIAATALHTLFNATSTVPSVGASGAIAGVMGAYLVLYPTASVTTLVPFLFIFFIRLPAWLVLGYWFIGQFLSGAATSIAYSRETSGGGVAFWAHVGGFVAGVILIKVFPARVRRAVPYRGW
jgi:membrane associated rhomboid family serine protease